MNNIPYGFQSPILIQEKLTESSGVLKLSNRNYDTIAVNPRSNPMAEMADISVIPLFHKDSSASCRRDHGMPAQDSRELLARASKKALDSERRQEAIAKANEYNIPFDTDKVDLMDLQDLQDKIDQYEALLLQAEELNLDWDLSLYDPAGLRQAIEYREREAYLEEKALYADFCSTRGIEV